ncbi:MAG: BLUF domain-containing protein [Oscillatoriales cyanobacterium SM2_1_8]|nr:BLUF domain-containing protein [Oscillatoriales cyanobacterium SM2_1_8]
MGLHRLVYVSQARPSLGYADLFDIMEKSERNNKPAGLTGLLCFGDGWFLQALEGHRLAISQTYNRIVGDTRHLNAELLEFSPIAQRDFLDWSMKAIQVGQEKQEREIILRHSVNDMFTPVAMDAGQCLALMKELAAFHQRRGV